MVYHPNWVCSNGTIDDVHKDSRLASIIQTLKMGQEVPKGFTYSNGALLFKGQLVLSWHSKQFY
jgi:hypothetical protein